MVAGAAAAEVVATGGLSAQVQAAVAGAAASAAMSGTNATVQQVAELAAAAAATAGAFANMTLANISYAAGLAAAEAASDLSVDEQAALAAAAAATAATQNAALSLESQMQLSTPVVLAIIANAGVSGPSAALISGAAIQAALLRSVNCSADVVRQVGGAALATVRMSRLSLGVDTLGAH